MENLDEEYYIKKTLSKGDKLYLSTCAILVVTLIFFASKKINN